MEDNNLSPLEGFGIAAKNIRAEDNYPAGTSFERVGISRMIAHIKRTTTEILKSHIGDCNDKRTHSLITGEVASMLSSLVHRTGIAGYTVWCDETNNSPETIEKGQMHLDINIKPNRAAEYINLSLILNHDGIYPADDHLAEEQFALHFDRAMEGV